MAHRDRKYHKHRGQRNQGYGSPHNHRGAGSRGGRGNAGSKKHKWSWFSKNKPGYFGRRGFKRPPSVIYQEKSINVGELDSRLEKLEKENKVKSKGKKYYINLNDLGFDKLLGSGKVRNPLVIKVDKYSPKALEKIEGAGGRIDSPVDSSAE